MSYSIDNLPEGIKAVSNDSEDFKINLSEAQMTLARRNVESFIENLFSTKVIGDDVRIAYMLKYESSDFQTDRYVWSRYNVESLLKFLNEDFAPSKLYFF